MPIKFRCQHCRQFLGISRSKAGDLVDCPTCGRTLRVPGLDGTVEPVPDPKLDMQDSELAGALNALAMIGQDDGDEPEDEQRPDTSAKPVAAKVLSPAPQPIVVEAPLPPEPVVPEPKVPKPAAPAPEPAATISSVNELAGLAEQAKQQPLVKPAISSSPSSSDSPIDLLKNPIVITALLGVAVVGLSIGFIIGRSGRKTIEVPGESKTENGQSANGAKVNAVPPPAERKAAVKGQITYRSTDDRRPPDAGARILVFPVERDGNATVAVAGFWANADKADFRISLAGLRALGGDAAVADKDGKYTVHLPPSDGSYHILVISSFHRRETEQIAAADTTLLSEYFDRPGAMMKQLSYKTDRIRFNGSTPETFNHVFE